MRMAYENSEGKTFEFAGNRRIRVVDAKFHKYSYKYDGTDLMFGIKLERFKKDPCSYPMRLSFYGSVSERSKKMDEIHDAAAFDRVNKKMGKLIRGKWYTQCYLIEGDTYPNEELSNVTTMDVSFLCPYPFWIREHSYNFKASDAVSTNSKKYAYRYAYRYANGLMNTTIVNDHYADCNFRMIVYGPIVNPVVYIGGHEYRVNIALETGEYLEIDSAAETATKVTAFGKRVNVFHYRSFENYVFEPVHPGKQNIGWSGLFSFDLILYEERSEPKWA